MWSEETLKYVGYCLDHPSLSYVDSDPVEALKGIIKVVNTYDPKVSFRIGFSAGSESL